MLSYLTPLFEEDRGLSVSRWGRPRYHPGSKDPPWRGPSPVPSSVERGNPEHPSPPWSAAWRPRPADWAWQRRGRGSAIYSPVSQGLLGWELARVSARRNIPPWQSLSFFMALASENERGFVPWKQWCLGFPRGWLNKHNRQYMQC